VTAPSRPARQIDPERLARGRAAIERLRSLRARLSGPKLAARELIDEGRAT